MNNYSEINMMLTNLTRLIINKIENISDNSITKKCWDVYWLRQRDLLKYLGQIY